MSNQPEALRLADALESGTYLLSRERDATAAELRRQHAEIERLKVEREALRAELREATEAVDDPAVNNLRTLPEAIRMLQERAKRAEAERDALRSLLTTAGLASAQEEHNKVRAERDALRADAERYAYVIANARRIDICRVSLVDTNMDQLSARIDAAREAK